MKTPGREGPRSMWPNPRFDRGTGVNTQRKEFPEPNNRHHRKEIVLDDHQALLEMLETLPALRTVNEDILVSETHWGGLRDRISLEERKTLASLDVRQLREGATTC